MFKKLKDKFMEMSMMHKVLAGVGVVFVVAILVHLIFL